MTINLQGILQQPGQGSSYWVLGDLYTFKALGEDTGKAYALVEIIVQPQSGIPPHIHSHEDEAFYIQEGELEFQLDQQTVVATAGTFLHSPKGQLHRYANMGLKPAKLLCWVTPAGLEKFFMEIGVPAIDITHSPTVSPADIEKAMATAPIYGLEIISPPNEISHI
ncbi:MAG: quercetin 2,3-dioxygenase [Mojavia pulchra JT2-VF2]|jgi:quercetin dioxygenase-like cupin family protein|uniref:Quercetin 2,3-dioxygenase n=1 Tax=Mojavia pulchra JT2-VF2 TaxID=287848 RepID=A0A951Q183_9NOST|nr:quercetin 2,3-dioxygenase [Mojavia pulchra JT2-VF2]